MFIREFKTPYRWPFVVEIYWSSFDSPPKGLVMQKAFSQHKIIMLRYYILIEFSSCIVYMQCSK